MNEIRTLRLIVNSSPQLAKYANQAEKMPQNGQQILNIAQEKSFTLKLSKVNQAEKTHPSKKDSTKKDSKRNVKYSVINDKVISLKN